MVFADLDGDGLVESDTLVYTCDTACASDFLFPWRPCVPQPFMAWHERIGARETRAVPQLSSPRTYPSSHSLS
jgi:hypothetical protein